MSKQITVGETYDAVQLSNRVVYQCPACRRFIAFRDQKGHCRCGARYRLTGRMRFRAEAEDLPPPEPRGKGRDDPMPGQESRGPTVGHTYDLAIGFGYQRRYKCIVCTRYIRDRKFQSTCICGARYRRVRDGLFRLERMTERT